MRIKQLTSYPNPNELGLGNTNETYIRVDNSLDVSDIFPDNQSVSIYDSVSGKEYIVKAKNERTEFRINQLGELYRNYNFQPGDEIKFTSVERQGKTKVFFSVTKKKRVFLNVGAKGTEVVNIGNISDYAVIPGQREFVIPISVGQLHLKYEKSEKKRADSPNETDFFSSLVNNTAISKGTYYLSLLDNGNILEEVKKNTVEFFEIPDISSVSLKSEELSLQKITYGAPGTGKSHGVDEITSSHPKENVFRTTFHPDSDYSTFVGCYKPTKKIGEPILSVSQAIDKLKEFKNDGKGYPCHRFATKYWNTIRELSTDDQKVLLKACGLTESMTTELSKGAGIGEYFYSDAIGSITYEFTPQVFTKAYIRAHQTDEPVFLVIEEINRGNCAQIFGDIFQLLDREDGVSKYSIKPDHDLEQYLIEHQEGYDPVDGMRLPKNLYIWATMNTSDQSLFPIDSAFKRRWDWKYMPIQQPDKKEPETIPEENPRAWKIKANKHWCYWWEFLQAINEEIKDVLESEDKQLGYFFAKPKAGQDFIDAKTFVSKVIFYLWNDVFKDEDSDIFKYKAIVEPWNVVIEDQKENLRFRSFVKGEDEVNEQLVHWFINNLLKKYEVKMLEDENQEPIKETAIMRKGEPATTSAANSEGDDPEDEVEEEGEEEIIEGEVIEGGDEAVFSKNEYKPIFKGIAEKCKDEGIEYGFVKRKRPVNSMFVFFEKSHSKCYIPITLKKTKGEKHSEVKIWIAGQASKNVEDIVEMRDAMKPKAEEVLANMCEGNDMTWYVLNGDKPDTESGARGWTLRIPNISFDPDQVENDVNTIFEVAKEMRERMSETVNNII